MSRPADRLPPVALLADDRGAVLLSPHAARLVALALDQLARQVARTDGRPPAGDLAELRRIIAAAVTLGSAAGTAGGQPAGPVAGSERMTAAEAAEHLGVSARAVRKAAAAGRYGARRHGAAWSLDGSQVRIACTRGAR